jgi:hypothetical protein
MQDIASFKTQAAEVSGLHSKKQLLATRLPFLIRARGFASPGYPGFAFIAFSKGISSCYINRV